MLSAQSMIILQLGSVFGHPYNVLLELKSASTKEESVWSDAKFILSSSRSVVNVSSGQLVAGYTRTTVTLPHAAATKPRFLVKALKGEVYAKILRVIATELSRFPVQSGRFWTRYGSVTARPIFHTAMVCVSRSCALTVNIGLDNSLGSW